MDFVDLFTRLETGPTVLDIREYVSTIPDVTESTHAQSNTIPFPSSKPEQHVDNTNNWKHDEHENTHREVVLSVIVLIMDATSATIDYYSHGC